MTRPLASRISRVVILGLAIAAATAGRASADASRLGNTFLTSGIGAIKRFPAGAYDSTNRVYLVTWGMFPVAGRFVAADGNALGSTFVITSNPAAGAMGPRTAYSPEADAFLVTWIEEIGKSYSIKARLLRYTAAGPSFLTGDITISANGLLKSTESTPNVAYSSASQEFLIVWIDIINGGDVRARRVGTAGDVRGGEIVVAATSATEFLPSVAYNSQQDEFFVVYLLEPGVGQYAAAQRVKAGTGAIVGSRSTLYGGVYENYPEVTYNSSANQYLVITYHINGANWDVYGRVVDGATGNPVGNILPIAANSFFEGGDGIGVAFNPAADAYFATFQGPNAEAWGVQVGPSGTSGAVFQLTASGAKQVYTPRPVADLHARRWLIVTSRDFDRIVGQLIQTDTGTGSTPLDPPPTSETIDLSSAGAPNGSWFFAEGVTGGNLGFDTYYLISNENSAGVQIRGYFASESGFAKSITFSVPALTRKTIRLADHVSGGSYSALFQSLTSGLDVYAQRNMLWGTNNEGSAGSAGVKDTSQTWYFAEGSRRSEYFSNYYLAFNPTQTAGTVTIQFFGTDGTGTVLATVTKDIPAQGRVSFDASTVAELANRDFSAIVTSTVPVVAERSMYWQADFRGGTNSFGTTASSASWYFAEGAAAQNFETYYTILNPNSSAVTVTPTFFLPDGPRSPRTITVQPNARETIWLEGEVGRTSGAGARFVSSGSGIIVERSIYWGRNWVEGTNAMGVSSPAGEWHLPDGGAVNGLDTWLLIANPNNVAVTVNVSVLRDDGLRIVEAKQIAANSRLTLFMNTFDSRLADRTFSMMVESVSGGDVVAELAIYLNRDAVDYWRTGSASFGIPR